ncbi:integral membrane protein hemolysin-III homolog [Striga asiatica]|uniref:Integral membrane protein hemolysin-III homolog n=1 Tax=Striga asiatica TaxID=4170 RepID=A0A5A7NZQ3_STRAF|nr:integral membrane protein hemolysin-III homolog [Striga asiatica]
MPSTQTMEPINPDKSSLGVTLRETNGPSSPTKTCSPSFKYLAFMLRTMNLQLTLLPASQISAFSVVVEMRKVNYTSAAILGKHVVDLFEKLEKSSLVRCPDIVAQIHCKFLVAASTQPLRLPASLTFSGRRFYGFGGKWNRDSILAGKRMVVGWVGSGDCRPNLVLQLLAQ